MIFLLFALIYQCGQIIALPGIFCWICWRFLKHKKSVGIWTHRLGFVPSAKKNNPIWFHAASVGETLAPEYFINELAAQGQTIYMTGGTLSGFGMSKNFRVAGRALLPFDFLPCILLAYYRIRPKALVIIEGDWWPNLIIVARLLRIPIYGLNARVSKKSSWGALIFRMLCKNIIQSVDKLFVQTTTDADLFVQNGINQNKIAVLGNIKTYNVFEKRLSLSIPKFTYPFPVLMAGSIHPSEDKIFLRAFELLKKDFPALKMIIVPRHLHWLAMLTEEAKKYGSVFVLKDKVGNHLLEEQFKSCDIIIGGALGIMFDLYAHATLFYLGGTFVPVGGHNLLEPASWGIPSIVGPYHSNCKDTLTKLTQCNAGFIAHDATRLYEISAAILQDPEQARKMEEATLTWLMQEAGACKQSLSDFAKLLRAE